MLPSFEMYLNILTGFWMPWLKENRKHDKFESFIRFTGSAFHGRHPVFFPAVIESFKKLNFGPSEKLISELELLSTAGESSFGNRLSEAFVSLPVQNYRGHFYNVLTGQSLGAYYNITEQFLRKCEGPETKDYYAEKMISGLHALMHIPLPVKIVDEEDKRIWFQVLLATGILFQLLLKKPGHDAGVLFYFDTRGWLEEKAQQMHFNQYPGQLISLFDRFLVSDEQTKQVQVISTEKSEINILKNDDAFSENVNLPDLLIGLQQEFNEMKQGLEIIVQDKQFQKKPEEQTDKWMKSKEVCEMMQISKSTLQRIRNSGKIKYSIVGNTFRYKQNDILQIMKENENTIKKQ